LSLRHAAHEHGGADGGDDRDEQDDHSNGTHMGSSGAPGAQKGRVGWGFSDSTLCAAG
jgi:hypothetical protein